jgi:hypothetical protein
VGWEQIAGARVMVKASFRDGVVTPSQGTPFFQNLNASSVGSFTAKPEAAEGFVDRAWLAPKPSIEPLTFVRDLRCDRPVLVKH